MGLVRSKSIQTRSSLPEAVKDGALKRRLILGCRISGASSSTHKLERILLPKDWDVVRDAMNLKRAAIPEGCSPELW